MDNQMPYPQWESACHGAPVIKHRDQEPKYTCSECGEACIARKKKDGE